MSDPETSPFEEHEKAFLASPDGEALISLYKTLAAEGRDDLLAAILDKIRPIQHRITLIQADADPLLLQALCRDPHKSVREVVASHNNIDEEVCFRLGEDMERNVRLALRKNPACHEVIRASLLLREKTSEENRVRADHLLEISWQARRAELDGPKLLKLIKEWTKLTPDELVQLTVEQANLLLDVLAAHLGQGKMPRKPRKRAKKR